MVILHDAMKPIHIVFLCFFSKNKKEQKPVSCIKTKKKLFIKQVGCFLFKKTGFSQP